MQPKKYWEEEGFKSAKHRKNKVYPMRKSIREYLKRKGIEDEEEIIQHCIGFVNFLGGSMTRRTFSWGNFYWVHKGLKHVFSYYTKETLGWEGATVPKENYKELFEQIMDIIKNKEKFFKSFIFEKLEGDDNTGILYSEKEVLRSMKVAYLKALKDFSIWSDHVPNGEELYEEVLKEYNHLFEQL